MIPTALHSGIDKIIDPVKKDQWLPEIRGRETNRQHRKNF